MMKKVMTLTGRLIMAAALTMGITACSSSEDAIEQQPQQSAMGTYTMTIKASKGNGNATTRALTLSDKTLTATWATSEHVYVKKGSTWATGSLVPDANDATANLSGELSGVEIAAGDELTLQFPKTGDISYAGQKGTLSNIAQNYDYAKADITVANVTNGNINVSGTTTFTNQQAIVKFTLIKKSDGTTKLSPTALTVSDGTGDIATLTDIPADTYSDPNNGAGVLYVAIPGFSDKTITLTATVGDEVYTYTKSNTSFSNGQYYEVTVKMQHLVDLSRFTSHDSDGWSYKAQDGDVLTGTLSLNDFGIYIVNGANVTLKDVDINSSGTLNNSHGIGCSGDATITLEGTNKVRASNSFNAGIGFPYNKTLTIQGSGSLEVWGGGNATGIGGTMHDTCGDITITGGTITARGGTNKPSAGIGAGDGHSCGVITISGGNVTAIGGGGGAGIGSASGTVSCTGISISSGTVNATGSDGGAGIGSGSNSRCGYINISGGTVTATGGIYAAGIGGSAGTNNVGVCGDITITGGTVNATGGNSSAGIGGGFGCGNITITSDVTKVTSTKGSSAPYSIGGGGGNGTFCGKVTIGGVVGPISESPYTYSPLHYPINATEATEAYVGSVIADNGKVYANVSDATTAGLEAKAMIAYVGSESNCTHGLALALANVGGRNSVAGHSEIIAGYTTVAGGTWRLPSILDWQYMFVG